MKKKIYNTSEIEIIEFTTASVITTSYDANTGDEFDAGDEF